MKTRFWVLTGLGVAAAATAAFLATERGKKWRDSVASSLDEWRNNLTHLAKNNGDGLGETAKNLKSNASRHLKNLPS